MAEGEARRQLHVWLPVSTLDTLKQLAAEERRTLAAQIAHLIDRASRNRTRRQPATEQTDR